MILGFPLINLSTRDRPARATIREDLKDLALRITVRYSKSNIVCGKGSLSLCRFCSAIKSIRCDNILMSESTTTVVRHASHG